MLKLVYWIIVFAFIFTSCSENKIESSSLVALGGKKYGGEFRMMSSEKITSFFPENNVSGGDMKIISQLFEPLMTYDFKSEKLIPCLAESFSVNEDFTEYSFVLRQDVLFHKDPCFSNDKERLLTAEDVKFSLEYAIDGFSEKTTTYLRSCIKGGVKIISATEIAITLSKSIAGFEKILTNLKLGVFSKKAFEKYGEKVEQHPVGTGPFCLKSDSKKGIELSRNEDYWQKDEFGNQLPFLGTVKIDYSPEKRNQLEAFQKKQIDVVMQIPLEDVSFIFGSLDSAEFNVRHRVLSNESTSINDWCLSGEDQNNNNLMMIEPLLFSNSKVQELFQKCKNLRVNQCPVLVQNDNFITLANLRVRDFEVNSMEHLQLKRAFIKQLD